MIRKIRHNDKNKIISILTNTGNFTAQEISIAVELIEIFLNNKEQKDYEIFVDEDNNDINGYICIGPRPLTDGTYDLYWIAVDPSVQSKGVGSKLIVFIEDLIKNKNGRLILIETSGKDSYEKERKFYEKNNYEILVNIKDFYKPGDPLVVYGKYLN